MEELAGRMREEAAELGTKLREKSLVHASDPKEKIAPPKPLDEVPYCNFAPLQNAVAALKEKAAAYPAAMAKAAAPEKIPGPDQKMALDAVLMGMERRLTLAKGLEGRPWYTHQVYAPGRYTGYAVKTLPGVREAIEQRNWTEADEQIRIVAGVLERFAGEIDRATAALRD